MNFSKSKVLLKKINAIHDSGATFENQLSSLEKDLLLQYLRELYECVLDTHEVQQNSQPPVTERRKEPIPKQDDVSDHARSGPAFEEAVPEPADNQKGGSNGQTLSNKVADPDLEDLFAHTDHVDLSQRFANTPIRDVSKAMGINEKILTINDLFKGNQQEFEEVVERLNSFTTFDDAKEYLINGIAHANDWGHKKHKRKAEVFVKLVRRRYL